VSLTPNPWSISGSAQISAPAHGRRPKATVVSNVSRICPRGVRLFGPE
jgi:hypothetical protein